jgi:hypothetical protein
MFRLLLILLVVAFATDALLFSGAYTQAAWHTLQQYTVEVRGPSDHPPAMPPPDPSK